MGLLNFIVITKIENICFALTENCVARAEKGLIQLVDKN